MSHFIVGLTGGIGSGKTTVANLFAEQGIDLIDADIVAREVVEPGSEGLAAIVEHFGEHVLQSDGQLDRSALRECIFSQPKQRLWLNECLHPLIRKRMLELIKQSTSAYAVLVVPLLFENGLDSLVDRTLVVDISPELQIKRTQDRDGVDKGQIENIIRSQMPRQQRLDKTDDIIDNQGEIQEIEQTVFALHKQYLSLSKAVLSTEAKL
ncbi:dephospho-CoA kinase [Parashewanella spongiae]|uniref:Dephospho-CoA kinase n=1 Tax=Parashewanella spongiae TaxID=342950 RepID=A0A3A6TRD7_9GAMM|nr:dephospho-CoA kinase [Parashewanella spongiae]MCL1078766.1 dephospho-CoA kinase [Parashewanella spongiae]RJY07784.1 dephospho-CoA kinase [Parashewanella spongiae]